MSVSNQRAGDLVSFVFVSSDLRRFAQYRFMRNETAFRLAADIRRLERGAERAGSDTLRAARPWALRSRRGNARKMAIRSSSSSLRRAAAPRSAYRFNSSDFIDSHFPATDCSAARTEECRLSPAGVDN